MPSRSRTAGTPKMAFDERQDRIFLHHAHLDEHFAEPQTLLRTFGERLIQLLRRNEVGADQLLTERRPPDARSGRGASFGADGEPVAADSLDLLVRSSPTTLIAQNSAPHRPNRERSQTGRRRPSP